MTQIETLELLVATLQQANATQSESNRQLTLQNQQLQSKLDELLAQVAWLNRQLFGRKSEKLSHLDPNQLSLFDVPVPSLEQDVLKKVTSEESEIPLTDKKKERRNRRLLEDLPVIEVIIEPQGIDLTQYKLIGLEQQQDQSL